MAGPSALNDAGWTPQRPQVLTLAVPLSRSYPQIDGAITYGHPAEWFALVRRSVAKAPHRQFNLPQLPPEWALADMLRHGDCLHGLQPGDVEIPEAGEPGRLLDALEEMGVPPDRYGPYLEAGGMPLQAGPR